MAQAKDYESSALTAELQAHLDEWRQPRQGRAAFLFRKPPSIVWRGKQNTKPATLTTEQSQFSVSKFKRKFILCRVAPEA